MVETRWRRQRNTVDWAAEGSAGAGVRQPGNWIGNADVRDPEVDLGYIGWMMRIVPTALYLGWIAFHITPPMDWMRILLNTVLSGLVGLILTEWLALRFAVRYPACRPHWRSSPSYSDPGNEVRIGLRSTLTTVDESGQRDTLPAAR
jgi:uncharacterized membrane protein YeaQ/YmgE (transglycosylase-associated protein family)